MLLSIVPMYVLLFFVTRITYGQSSSSNLLFNQSCPCDVPDSNFATGINLLYYKCDSENATIANYPITEPQSLLNVLDDNKRTIFYVFGYLQHPEAPNVQLIMKAFCCGKTDNIVLLDWSKYSNGTYISVFENAQKVGSLFARSIQLLVDNGLNVSSIYIVAHSLGAHIAGFAGKCNDFKIPRITGLDPANPFLSFYLPGCYLTPDDAEWVDVIHTDKGGYGTPTSMGTADYYVNGGTRPQPGCPIFGLPLSADDLCSHKRSVELYANSICNPIKVIACDSSLNYILGINCTKQINVGYSAENIHGSFYFHTDTM